MKLQERDIQRAASAEWRVASRETIFTRLADFLRKTLVIAELELRKLRHEPTDLLTRAVQPVCGC